MADEQFKRSDFLAAAKDLINTMGLKDDKGKPLPIDAKSNVAQLTKFILSATEEIDPGSDEFTPETLAILSHVGYAGFGAPEEPETETDIEPKADVPEKPEKKPAPKPADDLADDDDWVEPEPAEPLTLVEQVAAAKRLADLKDLVTGNLEFKKLVPKLKSYMGMQAPRMLKAEMQKIVGVPEISVKPVKEKAAKVKKEKTGGKYSRVDAVIAAIKEMKSGLTMVQIIESAITIYAEKTGTAPVEVKQADTLPKNIVEVLCAFNVLEKKGDLISLTP